MQEEDYVKVLEVQGQKHCIRRNREWNGDDDRDAKVHLTLQAATNLSVYQKT